MPRTDETPLGPRRVLLAEDDGDIRALLALALRRRGYVVAELTSGLELYNRVASCLFDGDFPPDVIISDIRLPGFTGLEVLGSVHRSELMIPVILITAYGAEGVRTEAEHLGAAALFLKPFDVDELVDAVDRF
jgi:CheY-like chemotaxis protein